MNVNYLYEYKKLKRDKFSFFFFLNRFNLFSSSLTFDIDFNFMFEIFFSLKLTQKFQKSKLETIIIG